MKIQNTEYRSQETGDTLSGVLFLIGLLAMLVAAPVEMQADDWRLLSQQEQIASGFNYKCTLRYYNLTNVVTSNGVTPIFPLLNNTTPFNAGTIVEQAAVYLTTPFQHAPNAVITMVLGDDAVTNRILTASSIGTNATAGTWYLTGTNTLPWIYTATNNIDIILTPGAASSATLLQTLTNGQMDIYLRTRSMDRFSP